MKQLYTFNVGIITTPVIRAGMGVVANFIEILLPLVDEIFVISGNLPQKDFLIKKYIL